VSPVLILLSGGADSSLLVSMAPPGSRALFVDWGQPAQREESLAATEVAARYGLPLSHQTTHLPSGAMASGVGFAGPRVVPARNLILASLAVAHAAHQGIGTVWIGASDADRAEYADCRRAFVSSLSNLCRSTYGVSVEAPLLDTPREVVMMRARNIGLRPWSCYQPRAPYTPCGTCNACLRSGGYVPPGVPRE